MSDHETNAANLAREIADVFQMVGITADDIDGEWPDGGLPDNVWGDADDVVRAMRRLRAYPHVVVDAGYSRHVPGKLTKADTLAILRDREAHPDPFEGFPQ